jgi:hypothetical protein
VSETNLSRTRIALIQMSSVDAIAHGEVSSYMKSLLACDLDFRLNIYSLWQAASIIFSHNRHFENFKIYVCLLLELLVTMLSLL